MKTRKRLLLVASCIVLILMSVNSYAQSGNSFGVKGGLNYASNGDLTDAISSARVNPDRNVGYHIGVFGKLGNRFYLRPELVYTSTKSDYNSEDFTMQKIDLPVLAGARIIGPLSIFAGPSFQYILDTDFSSLDIRNVENDFSVGLNFGIALSIKKIGIDLRYERSFTDNEATLIDNNLGPSVFGRLDTRPDQLILSLSVNLL